MRCICYLQAFNGLLKTLEEPPPRLKFILATTEVKNSVTILSRCQRFDLKRVDMDKLFLHLKKISENEKGNITDEAIELIARTSEGSVRDSISLLDRALISKPAGIEPVNKQDVREMLGLADKSKVISLLKDILAGDEKEAVKKLKELIDDGLDAKNFLNDILEILYLFGRRISLGPIDKDMSISETEIKMIDEYSKNLDMQDIGLFWQLTIKTIDDLRIIGDENLALEMYIIQLSHLKRIDESKVQNQSIETQINYKNDSINKTKSEKNLEKTETNKTKNQLKSTNQIKTNPMKSFSQEKSKNNFEITNFGDLINLANKEKEIELKYDLERNVKLVSFNKGKIDISFSDKLNQNFIKNLTEKLLKWTGEIWIISLSRNADAKSLFEKNLESKNTQLEDFKNSSIAREIESAFPDAELIDIKEED